MENTVQTTLMRRKSFRFTFYHFKLLLISTLLSFSCNVAFAQKPANFDSLPYQEKMEIFLGGIKTDSLHTGTFYNRVAPWSLINVLPNDSIIDTMSNDRFMQAVYELRNASHNKENHKFAFQVYEAIRKACRNTKVIYIGAYNTSFQEIDTNRIKDSTIYFNSDSLLVSNPTSAKNPFITKNVVFAGFLREDDLNRNDYVIKFDPRFFFGFETVPQSITLTLADGVHTLQQGDSVVVDLDLIVPLGIRNFDGKIELILKPGSPSVSVVGRLKRDESKWGGTSGENNSAYPDFRNFLPCGLTSTIIEGYPFDASQYPNGDVSSSIVELSFYYGSDNGQINCNRTRIKKPVILLDGFDPEDTRLAPEIYGKFLKYGPANIPSNLGNDLRKKGYDVVIANFPNLGSGDEVVYPYIETANPRRATPERFRRDFGATYVERNGLAIVKAIQYLNQELRSQGINEPLVIVGPSMGGLISRYALSYMEKKETEVPESEKLQWRHNTRVWFSFDSPHLGANIAVGAQSALYFMGHDSGNEKVARDFDVNLRSVAAKQMLLYHFDSRIGETIQGPLTSYRDVFVSNLRNNGIPSSTDPNATFYHSIADGFPVNTKRAGISNGYIKAQPHRPASENDKLVKVSGQVKMKLELLQYFPILNIIDIVMQQITIVDAQLSAMATPFSGNSEKVFYGYYHAAAITEMADNPTPRNPDPVGDAGRVSQTKRNYYAQSFGNTNESLDITSGGINRANLDIRKGFMDGIYQNNWGAFSIRADNTAEFGFTFIPLRSGLALRNGNTPFNDDLSTRDLVCTCETPFDSYYAEPEKSEEHVTLTSTLADFVMKEIDGISPPHKVAPIEIEGGGHACSNSDKALSPNFTYNPYLCLQSLNTNPTDYLSWSSTGTPPGTNITFSPNTSSANPYDANMRVDNPSTLGNAEVKFTYAIPDRLGKPCKLEGRKTVSFGSYLNPPQTSTSNLGDKCVGDVFGFSVRYDQPFSPINNSISVVEIEPNPYLSFTQTTSGHDNYNGVSSFIARVTSAPTVRPVTIQIRVRLKNECNDYSAYATFTVRIVICAEAVNINLNPSVGLANVTEHISGFVTGRVASSTTWKAELLDYRHKTIAQTTINGNGLFNFDLRTLNVEPAKYSVIAFDDSVFARPKDWYLLGNATSHLIVSPNPSVATIDKEVNAEIYNSELSSPPYFVSFQYENGSVIDTFTITDKYFTLNIKDLEAGIYPVVVTSADGTTFSETIDLKLKGEPYLQIANNPVDQELNLSFLNPIAGTNNVNYLVVSSMGIIKNSGTFGTQTNLQLRLNVADYDTGIYNVIVTDGYKNYSIQFIKL